MKDDREQAKRECDDLRQEIAELKDRIAEKKKPLVAVRSEVLKKWEIGTSALSGTISSTTSSLSRLQHKNSENRAKLCRETASLMRLRRRRRQRDNPEREQYSIAGLTLPDLREISSLRCADLTAVLASVAHLIILLGFQLGIRLPAEITEPFPDHPLHTISTPQGSYRGTKPDFQQFLSPDPQSDHPSTLDLEPTLLLRPRPLFIGSPNRERQVTRDERVFNVQKRDETSFRAFTEGIALLAWDVAYLCRSQGFTAGTNSWEEICNMGRNLHQLLSTTTNTPTVSRTQSDRLINRPPMRSKKSEPLVIGSQREALGELGRGSDLSTISRDVKADQQGIMTLWIHADWYTVAKPLARTLLTEIASADWELLLDDEWDDGGEQFDEAVFVKTKAMDGQQYDDARSIMTTRTQLEEEARSAARVPGTSGWTKLKSRDKDE